MTITPGQARESLSAHAEHLRRIAEHCRAVGAHEAAEDLGKEADILDWAIARIAELEALKRAMADSEGADRDSCANDRRPARANCETTDGSIEAT